MGSRTRPRNNVGNRISRRFRACLARLAFNTAGRNFPQASSAKLVAEHHREHVYGRPLTSSSEPEHQTGKQKKNPSCTHPYRATRRLR